MSNATTTGMTIIDGETKPNKIDANLNFGFSVAK